MGEEESRDSSVGKVTGWNVGFRLPARARNCLLDKIQTGSEAHPAPYSVGTGSLSPGVKRLGREAVRAPLLIVGTKKTGTVAPFLYTLCLIN
jgi:hypothetical protein